MTVQSDKNKTKDEGEKSANNIITASFVKVSMDGAPYLRKIDLKMYNSYKELSGALEKMFSSFTTGNIINTSSKHFFFSHLSSKKQQMEIKKIEVSELWRKLWIIFFLH